MATGETESRSNMREPIRSRIDNKMKQWISSIIAGLCSDNPEETEKALGVVKQLLAEDRIFSSLDVTLLLDTQKVIDPVDGSPYSALNQAYDLVVDKALNHWAEARNIPEVMNWFDEQMDFDGLIMAKVGERSRWDYEANIFPTIIGLRSDRPEQVKWALSDTEWRFFYEPDYIGLTHVSLLAALRDVIERKDVLGEVIVSQARRLLMDALWVNRRLVDLEDSDLKPLVIWYHQQEDSQPFDSNW